MTTQWKRLSRLLVVSLLLVLVLSTGRCGDEENTNTSGGKSGDSSSDDSKSGGKGSNDDGKSD